MKFKIFIPPSFVHMFEDPPAYRFVRVVPDTLEEEWWLFPFNYPVRFWYWLESKIRRPII